MRALLCVGLLFCAACLTQFTGSAHVDPSGCKVKCDAAGLEMQGMVFMGEYSSACVCGVPRKDGAPPPAMSSASAVVGAVAGVAMQSRRATGQNNAGPMHSY